MLSAAVRPSAHAAVCAACARQARRTAHLLASSSSRLSHSSRAAQQEPAALRPSLASRRTQATLAQASDRIEPSTDVAEEHKHDSPDATGEAIEAAQEGEQKEREAPPAELNEVEREKEEQVGASSGEGADGAAAEVDGQDAAVLDVPPATEEADQALASLLDALQAEADSKPSSASTFDEPAQPSDTLTSSSSAVPSASELSPVPSELNEALAEVYGASTSSSDTVDSPLSTTPDPEDPPPGPVRGANLPENGPQLSDLFRLRPKRFRIPVADSPDSFRTVYQKVWSDAADKVGRAFNRKQLNDLAGPDGLALDLTDARLRTATPGKKQRFWKSKRMEQMSKRELVHTILILEFGMIHPDRVPEAVKRTGPQTVDALVLSNRTLFLLLSPKSRTIAKITNELGVKTQFRRSPQSGQIELMLKGNKKSVAAAREEVEMVDDLRECGTTDLTLPLPASDLRPEIFQAVSRAAKVFLEPSSSSPSTTLSASAVWPASLTTGSRLLNTALSAHLAQTRTSLYASVPSNLDRLRYSMTPLTPYTPVSVLEHAGAAAFARVKSLSLAPKDVVEESDPAFAAQRELADWTERTKLERTERIPVFIPETRREASSTGGLLSRLEAPFAPDAAVEVQARFGHVAFPLYPPATPEKNGLEPVCQGQWPFRTLVSWVEKQASKVKSVFIPSPPTDLLQSTGVLSALPVAPSPLSSIFSLAYPSPTSLNPAADPNHELARRKDLDKWPAMESREYRRWVYRPQVVRRSDRAVEEGAEGEQEATESVGEVEADLTERLEVEMEVEEDAMGRLELLKTQIRVVQENKADLMVPTAATDAQISMSSTVILPSGAYPEQLAADNLHNVTRPPLTVTHGPRTYVLSTDRRVRRTVFTPPKPASGASSLAPHPLFASSSASKPTSDASGPALQQVQETWTSLYPTDVGLNAARGSDVWLALTPLDEPVKVDELRRSGAFKRGLEVVEQRMASVAQPSSLSSSSTPSKLLSLPVELLHAIFSLAYPPSGRRPTTPICKALHPLLLDLVYAKPTLKSYAAVEKLCATVTAKPEMGALVKDLIVSIPWASRKLNKPTKEHGIPELLPRKAVLHLFSSLKNARSLEIHGSTPLVRLVLLPETAVAALPAMQLVVLDCTFRGWDDPFHPAHYAALPFYRHLNSLCLVVNRLPSSIESSLSDASWVPPLVFPCLSQFSIEGPIASSMSVRNLLSAFDNIVVLYLIDNISKASILPVLHSLPSGIRLFELAIDSDWGVYDHRLETFLPTWDSLEVVEFAGFTAATSPSFYDTLRALPNLATLRFGLDASVSTDELTALISGPRKHPSLKTVILEHTSGKMGTRIEDDADGEPFYDSDDEPSVYGDWRLPVFTASCSRKGLKALLEVAAGSGVKVEGNAVDAIQVAQAFEHECDYVEAVREEMHACECGCGEYF
ncbi:hypothetical protein JCM8097_001069 [Rhodosporidiobolus ruineniae]